MTPVTQGHAGPTVPTKKKFKKKLVCDDLKKKNTSKRRNFTPNYGIQEKRNSRTELENEKGKGYYHSTKDSKEEFNKGPSARLEKYICQPHKG